MSDTSSEQSLNGLYERFGKLGVATAPSKDKESTSSHGTLEPSEKFQREIGKTGFAVFEPIADLGYFGWKPKGTYRALASVTTADMTDSIEPSMKPDAIVSTKVISSMLPVNFAYLSPQERVNKYPYNQYYLASLHVAKKHRNLELDKVDFFFGGSTLEMLATMTIPDGAEYIVTKVPGTDIITVAKHKEYTQNLSDPGFQFERLVTGKSLHDRHDKDFVEHLQLMKVGAFQVLFSTEIDACDSNGDPVEVKASNPAYWGTKTMFQMISSGSLHLYSGQKRRRMLYSVLLQDLSTIARDALSYRNVEVLETNIENGMKALVKEAETKDFKDENNFKIRFVQSTLKLVPFSGEADVIFPSEEVVKEMLA